MKASGRAGVWVLAVALGAGCGDASPATEADGGGNAGVVGPVATLGTGLSVWEDIPTRGARMELVMGPQGGFHLLGRARFVGLPGDVSLAFALRPTSGGPSVSEEGAVRRVDRRGLTRWGDGWETTSAELVVLAPGAMPSAVVGRTLRLELSVTDAAGRTATDAREVTVTDNVP